MIRSKEQTILNLKVLSRRLMAQNMLVHILTTENSFLEHLEKKQGQMKRYKIKKYVLMTY